MFGLDLLSTFNRPSVNLSQVAGVQPLVKKQVICAIKLQTVYIATK